MEVATIPTSYYMTAVEQHSVMNGGVISIRNCPTVPSVWDASQEYRRHSDCRFEESVRSREELVAWVKANRLRWIRAENDKKAQKSEEEKKKKKLTPFERELRAFRIGLIQQPEDPAIKAARDRQRLRAVINGDEDLLALSARFDIDYLFK